MQQQLFDYLQSRQLPTGRTAFVVQAILDLARQYGDTAIEDKGVVALDANKDARRIERAYRHAKTNPSDARGDAASIDREIDSVCSGMYSVADGQTSAEPAIAETAAEFMEAVFPDGLKGLVIQRFEEQLLDMDALLERFDGDLAGHVDTMGLRSHVNRLENLVPAFRAELAKESGQEVTYDMVKNARLHGLDRMASTIYLVLATYDGDSEEHVERREAYLTEFARQNAYVAEAFRRKQPVTDIDPDTGEPVDDEEPAVEPVA